MEKYLMVFLSTLLSTGLAYSQKHETVSMYFGGDNTWDPVHVKVEEKAGSAQSSQSFQIRFNATNSTYYPFLLKVDFIQFENLAPRPPAREEKVGHGTTLLYNFSKQVENGGYGYNYSYRYRLQPSDSTITTDFPYLIPLKEGQSVVAWQKWNMKFVDSFACKPGDTIYCMRRGVVTAVPETETPDFRLTPNDCVEVLHSDGTYMTYRNLRKTNAFATPGKIVLPGQPVGIVSDSSYLQVRLLRVSGSSKQLIASQTIKYTIGDEKLYTYGEIEGNFLAVFPGKIVVLELKGRELKQVRSRK